MRRRRGGVLSVYVACCVSATPTINNTWVDMDVCKPFELLHWKYGLSANGAPVAALLCCCTRSVWGPASAAPAPPFPTGQVPDQCFCPIMWQS